MCFVRFRSCRGLALETIGIASYTFAAGPPGDNRFYFDRLPLLYPYHWGGVTSTIHSDVPSHIDVYAGGFGAEFGTDAQAVIDIVSRRGRTDRVGATFDVNMLYTEGLLEGPLGKRGSWYLAGRRSYIDLFFRESDIDGLEVFPRFWDYQTKVSYTLSEKTSTLFQRLCLERFDGL